MPPPDTVSEFELIDKVEPVLIYIAPQVAFAPIVTVKPPVITTESVAAGTPVGLQVPGVAQVPFAAAVFVAASSIVADNSTINAINETMRKNLVFIFWDILVLEEKGVRAWVPAGMGKE